MKHLDIQIQPAAMIPTVDSIAQLVHINPAWLEQMNKNYYIYHSASTESTFYYCPIHEIMYEDIMSCPLTWVQNEYASMVSEFGQQLVDQLILKDPAAVLRKLRTTLERSIDHTFDGECCVEIGYIPPYNGMLHPSVLPGHILTMLRQYFDVSDGPDIGYDKYIIRKREDKNGNNAD